MFQLYSPEFLEVSKRHNINPSVETQQKHQDALHNKGEGDVKIYKKENKNDHSLLFLANNPVVVGAKLGQGGFGVVKDAVVAPSGEHVAIKRVFFDPTGDSPSETALERKLIREDFFAEVEVLKIMGYYRGHGTRMSRDGEKGYILMQLHPGIDLFKLSLTHSMTFEQTVKIMLGILLELRKLHDHQPPYLHNDLKPENIKIDLADSASPAVKLMDFGASRKVGDSSATLSSQYTAPEVTARTPRAVSSEIYSFGIVAVGILKRMSDNHPQKLNLSRMIRSCLSESHTKRPAVPEIESSLNEMLVPAQPAVDNTASSSAIHEKQGSNSRNKN